ncbi:MAG: ATP-binding cassette domain-containing protein, partial [Nitriliruptoraceae bacterium]|nr:ATP-binding cassette domain-containing protein [Nitriliruptoraceae bacterium]
PTPTTGATPGGATPSGATPRGATPRGATPAGVTLRTRDLAVTYGAIVALRGIDLTLRRGEIVALMGRNGAGKSTLLGAAVGMVTPSAGSVHLDDADPASLAPRALLARVGLVPQEPADLLYRETVEAECADADRDHGAPTGTTAALLARLLPGVTPDTHPRDLSEGQRLALVLALVLAGDPPLVLLDEPTRGLDYAAKGRLVTVLRELAGQGRTVVLATHDVELAAAVATRTIVLAEGEIVVDGPTDEVVVGSPAFAPQVAKIVAPLPWLTVEQVVTSLEVA